MILKGINRKVSIVNCRTRVNGKCFSRDSKDLRKYVRMVSLVF